MLFGFSSDLMKSKEEAYKRQHPEAQLPDSFFRDLMDDQLGRGFLNGMPDAREWAVCNPGLTGDFKWLRFNRLPIQPGKEEENTLLESWQSVLSACHTMNLRVAFVLVRRKGSTEIYLGAGSRDGKSSTAAEQLRQCMAIHMPGAELQEPSRAGFMDDLLENYTRSGVVTGIPSLRSENSGVTLQTLDKLARGIHINGQEKTYAMVVIADPSTDGEIVELQQTFLNLKSEIHQFVGYSAQEGTSEFHNEHTGVNMGLNYSNEKGSGELKSVGVSIVEGLAMGALITGNPLGAAGMYLLSKGIAMSASAGVNYGKGRGYSSSSSVTREYRDFVAKYCEDLIDRNITRLEQGRNLGFWQTGIYVLTEDNATTDSLLGILRSVYSGKDSFVEPIRVFNTGGNANIAEHIKSLNLLPLPGNEQEKKQIGQTLGIQDGWHVLGRMYENFSTALTTEELSIASSLPRREVPGLRMVKNAISFANNTAAPSADAINMGQLVDMGVPQQLRYRMDLNSLVRHTLVCGTTGTGKSTTCKKIIQGARSKGVPVMIIEPAKDDYVRWAIEQNKHLPEGQQYLIIMPGVSQIENVKPMPLHLCPFQPAAWKDSPVNLVQHAEALVTMLNACLPSEDVIPIIIEEAVHECLETEAVVNGIDITEVDNPQMSIYPCLYDLENAGNRVIDRKTYEKKVKENFREILRTRFAYLQRGTRGKILNAVRSTDFEQLFNRPVVINLSRLSGSKDKSLISSLLLLALQEYRISRYQYDDEYRKQAQQNKLLHLVVLEEAHNVLTRPGPNSIGTPQQAAAELFGNMLSEIRSYGQGMMIIDQFPTRLIEDAIKNTNYKIAHRLISPEDIRVMSTAMMLRDDQANVIPALEIGNAIVCGDMDESAAWVKVERN